MGKLDGKVALISGGARGQGAAEAETFAREGARVVFGDIRDAEGEKVEAASRAAGGDAVYVHLDVTREADWEAAVGTALNRYGRLDVLINNAAILIPRVPIEERTAEEWDRVMAVNAKGVFLGTKHAIPAMRRSGGGSIVNISSVAGIGQSLHQEPAYAASKGAIRIFTKVTASQHAKDRIRCNSVHPGPVDTEMFHSAFSDPEALARRLQRIPLGRMGTVAEIVTAVLYLASDESSYITGSELVSKVDAATPRPLRRVLVRDRLRAGDRRRLDGAVSRRRRRAPARPGPAEGCAGAGRDLDCSRRNPARGGAVARFPEYDSLDALGLAALVRAGEVSAVETVEAAIERIVVRDPALNAVVHRMFEQARAAARGPLADGPFAGVPFLLKDLMAAHAGEPLASGSRFFRDWRPPHHAEIVRRWLAAGVIVVGKTATPELGLLPVTESAAFGPTRNAWDPARTSGGSSGGSATAVAARLVPMASGGDGGGSIRIPASCCGVFGMKPSRGRVPHGPDVAEAWQGFATEHVLTISVRDSAAMLDATHGPDVGAFHRAPAPARPFLDEVGRPPGRLRIAWSAEPYLPAEPVHPDCRAALEAAVALLGDLGHELVEARPVLDGHAWARAFLTVIAAEVHADLREAARQVGRAPRVGDFEDATWMLGRLGGAIGAGDYADAVRLLKQTGRRLEAFMAERNLDGLLSPTLARPPIPIGTLLPGGIDRIAQTILSRVPGGGRVARVLGALDRSAASVFSFVPFTPVFNASGQPSMSVPLHWSPAGVPIGVMLTARYGEDGLLFRLAGQLESARPWRERKPPLVAGA